MGARTPDALTKSAFKDSPAGYGSYDLLTFVTGCRRQRVYLFTPVASRLPVVLSQRASQAVSAILSHVRNYQIDSQGPSLDDLDSFHT